MTSISEDLTAAALSEGVASPYPATGCGVTVSRNGLWRHHSRHPNALVLYGAGEYAQLCEQRDANRPFPLFERLSARPHSVMQARVVERFAVPGHPTHFAMLIADLRAGARQKPPESESWKVASVHYGPAARRAPPVSLSSRRLILDAAAAGLSPLVWPSKVQSR